MAGRIGYSLVKLATGKEVAWSEALPWTVDYPGGTSTFDKPGLVVPTSDNPTHKIVERWQTDDQPEDQMQTGFANPTFDGTQVNVTGVYEPLPVEHTAATDRANTIKSDPDVSDLRTRLKTATPAEIQAWITTNVTDLASARTVLIKIVKYLALTT